MKKIKWILLIQLFAWISWGLAQEGGIPNRYMNDPAVDLTYKGELLYPDEVHRLVESSAGGFDISTLNPVQTSDLWKDIYLGKLPEDKNPIGHMDEVEYHSPVLSPSGIFRFNVHNSGDGKLYTMMLSKTVHSVLLAKALLRKIGYQIPDIKRLPRVVLKFANEKEKLGFVSYLQTVALAGSPKSWIIEELDGNRLLLQDLIVMESNHPIYNLAVGVTEDMIQGRRLLSALAVPLTIVNLTESVNMLRWNAGIISHKKIVLFHDRLEDFNCTWDDARWITRRIEKLSRADWEEIVAQSEVPKPVQQVLVEKVISRRNSVMKLFSIDHKEMKVDTAVSNGVDVVDGKITKQDWPGYGSRFAHGDPDSPLADSEIRSWVKSRAISTLMDIAVSQVNQLPYLGTDLNQINNEKFQSHIEDAILESIKTKKEAEIPLKSWVFPTVRGQLVLSRNLVTGTYLGTDNLVQLVDTVGVAIGAGAFVGTMGLPTPISANAQGEAFLMRSYAHLRPITSIKKSLKYPFKNIFIPLVKQDYGQKLHEAASTAVDPEVDEDTKRKAIERALEPFKKTMEVGESIIITDSLATYAGGQVGAGIKKMISASLSFAPGHMLISRFHVHRRSEHIFHIYRDLGQAGSLRANFHLDSLIPVLKLSWKKSSGDAQVKFYSLNLNPANPEVLENAALLRRAIISSSTKDIDSDEEKMPYVLKTEFKEKTPSVNLGFWQWNWLKSTSNIKVTNPSGDSRYFRRQYHGDSHGKNYQAYANALISHWVNMLFDKQAGLTDSTGSNPGYSFKGMARTKFLTFDEEVDAEGRMIEPFIRLSRIYNGWSIKREEAEKLLSEIETKYRHDFYEAPILSDTHRIFMYNISVNALFYRAGIEHLFQLSENDIKRIYRTHKSFKHLVISPAQTSDEDSGVKTFLRFMKRFRHYEEKQKEEKANKYLLKAFAHAEENLTLKGLTELMGGEENLYINSRIDGFREGDEDGDRSIISSSLGDFGAKNIWGPVIQMQRQTDMLEGEFFIYWMMTRLI